ncbi:hypothetical protein HMPREF0044_1028 [Gleimia coleocanis DSM 15436]|uniref:Uncharacterized protein n=2 Tax=Gleimia TaxID=2692113 RepID=C0W0F0_9ACTO|nr:hypothetical protein HMPREF0044_1028 [Gleimia coleocanis DSM 15436]
MDGAPVSLQELYANLQPGALENYLNKNPGAFQIETDPGFKFTAIVKPSEDFQADYSLGEIVKIIPVCKGDNVAVTMFMNGKESGSGECSTPSIAWTIPADFELKNPVFRFETPGADYAEIAIFQKSDGTYCW